VTDRCPIPAGQKSDEILSDKDLTKIIVRSDGNFYKGKVNGPLYFSEAVAKEFNQLVKVNGPLYFSEAVAKKFNQLVKVNEPSYFSEAVAKEFNQLVKVNGPSYFSEAVAKESHEYLMIIVQFSDKIRTIIG
jgi:hypothetical protein